MKEGTEIKKLPSKSLEVGMEIVVKTFLKEFRFVVVEIASEGYARAVNIETKKDFYFKTQYWGDKVSFRFSNKFLNATFGKVVEE